MVIIIIHLAGKIMNTSQGIALSIEDNLRVDELIYILGTTLRELEKLCGREAVKDLIKSYPLPF